VLPPCCPNMNHFPGSELLVMLVNVGSESNANGIAPEAESDARSLATCEIYEIADGWGAEAWVCQDPAQLFAQFAGQPASLSS
jgi:hypothetical protein